MSAERVEAALDAIGRQDAALGGWAQVAADGLTAGEGEEVLSQAAVQAFLWYRLPTEYPAEAWVSIARAMAALMEALGRQRLRIDRRLVRDDGPSRPGPTMTAGASPLTVPRSPRRA